MEPVEWLTVGLLIFAGVQSIVQIRTERTRRDERIADREERLERSFQYAWAEHFRFESLANAFDRFDLVELALLDVLRPTTVVPHDAGKFIEALTEAGREAGVLGGVTFGVLTDLERTVGIFVNSVKAFSREIPPGMQENAKPRWVRDNYGLDLDPWEKSIRELTRQVALLNVGRGKTQSQGSRGANPRLFRMNSLRISRPLRCVGCWHDHELLGRPRRAEPRIYH